MATLADFTIQCVDEDDPDYNAMEEELYYVTERPQTRVFVGMRYVTAVVAGQVVTAPRQSVLVGPNGELTLPVQDE